ncbi:MAG: transposase [Lachnospiraceae bacterium]|nr:transposase [Lachnospiraceae bacterium]
MNNNRKFTLNTNQNIIVEFTDERIIPASGLAVVGALLGKSDFAKKLNRMDVTQNRSQHQIKNGDIILTYIGMLCMGKPYFEAVHEMDEDKAFYQAALGITRSIPSEETLRQRMDDIGDSLRETILNENIELLISNKIQPTALPNGFVPVDIDAGCYFIIKRNLRRESKDGWFDMAKQYCKNITTPREGKTVYVGSDWKDVCSKQFEKEFTLCAGYEITERTVDKYGQILLIPEIEVETWWTNLGATDEEIIQLYHAHGECEQFHSEIKTDMDLERLPSGKFATNALVLELGLIVYNILRMIGQGTIGGRAPRQKRNVKRRRLHTVISNLIMMASHVTTHARQLVMGLGKSNVWRHLFADYCESSVAV